MAEAIEISKKGEKRRREVQRGDKRKRVSDEVEAKVGEFENGMSFIRAYVEELLNIVGHPSTKINNSNQEKIRNIVMDIMEEAIIQSNAINALIGRVLENRDLVSMMVEKKDEVKKKERG